MRRVACTRAWVAQSTRLVPPSAVRALVHSRSSRLEGDATGATRFERNREKPVTNAPADHTIGTP